MIFFICINLSQFYIYVYFFFWIIFYGILIMTVKIVSSSKYEMNIFEYLCNGFKKEKRFFWNLNLEDWFNRKLKKIIHNTYYFGNKIRVRFSIDFSSILTKYNFDKNLKAILQNMNKIHISIYL